MKGEAVLAKEDGICFIVEEAGSLGQVEEGVVSCNCGVIWDITAVYSTSLIVCR